ncbi:MAG: peptidoglycan editing factor PgeF [Proteobacteria bacterium]|nr:peptidoglycan editing factor PgeF [Pseudomonadota bacterium]
MKNPQEIFPGAELSPAGFFTLTGLSRFPGFVHGFTRKVPEVGKLRVAERKPVLLQQVHGHRIVAVEKSAAGFSPEGITEDKRVPGDGLITDVPGVILAIRVADCLPVIFLAPEKGVVGIAHAGWRGTHARIVEKLITLGRERYRLGPEDLWVGLGPAIGPCCYPVGPEVREAFRVDFSDADDYITLALDGSLRLDLVQANQSQLRAAGVPADQIFTISLCTFCRDEHFYSARREGGKGGRQVAWVGKIPASIAEKKKL